MKEDKTLKAVSRVVTALSEKRSHVPHRDSILTRLVKEAFGGRGTSVFILLARSDAKSFDETHAMLTFLQQVKAIKNQPTTKTINRAQEISKLEATVARLGTKLGMPNALAMHHSDIQLDMQSAMELVEIRDLLAEISGLRAANLG